MDFYTLTQPIERATRWARQTDEEPIKRFAAVGPRETFDSWYDEDSEVPATLQPIDNVPSRPNTVLIYSDEDGWNIERWILEGATFTLYETHEGNNTFWIVDRDGEESEAVFSYKDAHKRVFDYRTAHGLL